MTPSPSLRHGTFAVLAALGIGGCQMIAGLTDLKPRPLATGSATAGSGGESAGPASTGSASSGQGGSGGNSGQGGSGGSSGQGGSGGSAEPECTNDDDCAVNTPCVVGTCTPAGTCAVAPVPKGESCGQGTQCDGAGNCVDGGCVDGQKGALETDVDCGGACPKPCDDGKGCAAGKDCANGHCDLSAPHANGSAGTCVPCTDDLQCATGKYCDAGSCFSKKANGAPCPSTAACQSGHCTDGVCCETACSGACEACSSAVDPSIFSGSCSPLPAASPSKQAGCGPYLCDGAKGSCPTSCAGDASCVDEGYCDKDDATCHALELPYGAACDHGNECTGAHYCVDATCCMMMSCPSGASCKNPEGVCK